MPWREVSAMEQRLQLVQEYQGGFFTMRELAAQYGVSTKTAYKWVRRYDAAAAMVSVSDRSRRPAHVPSRTASDVVEAVLAARRRHPHWGAKKLLWYLARREPGRVWPRRSTVCGLLRQAGLVTPRRRRERVGRLCTTLAPITAANGTWTTDFKGQFRLGAGPYCYPLTLRDGWSRFVLRCDGLLATTVRDTRRCFERAFAEYGLPDRIRSDNGKPFAGVGIGRLSRLAVWWMRLGIIPERIALGRPDQNGSHEHFHGVLKAATARPPAASLRAQQARFDRFCTEYNEERPHEALEGATPASRYTASPRPWPRRLPAIEYPGHMEIRRVSGSGCLCWERRQLFLTDALCGEYVGLEEVIDGVWTVYFVTTPVARLDARRRCFLPLPR